MLIKRAMPRRRINTKPTGQLDKVERTVNELQRTVAAQAMEIERLRLGVVAPVQPGAVQDIKPEQVEAAKMFGKNKNNQAPEVPPANVRPATWIGDETSTDDLAVAVERLITVRPMYTSELVKALGARQSRIQGIIIRLQRSGARVVNLADRVKGLWFVLNDDVVRDLIKLRDETP